MKHICNVLSNDDGSLQFPPAMGQSANPDLANVNRGGGQWKEKKPMLSVREAVIDSTDRMIRIIDQAAKVRTLQKQWYKSIKDEKRDYDILAESKAAEKELELLYWRLQ